MVEPIILLYGTEDYITVDLFKEIIKENGIDGREEVTTEKLSRTTNNGLEDVICLVENRGLNEGETFKGIDYGRPEEGYQGPLVHLGFQQAISKISIALIENSCPTEVFGNSEDALYFLDEGTLILEDGRKYELSANSFVFLKNERQYTIEGNKILLSRFGQQVPLRNVHLQQTYDLDEEVRTCQWGLMDFVAGKTLAAHSHLKKREFFYFGSAVDIDADLKDKNNPNFQMNEGFITINQATAHTMQTNYGDVWFHSLNVPDILNDSERL